LTAQAAKGNTAKNALYSLFQREFDQKFTKKAINIVKKAPAVAIHRGNFCPKKFVGKGQDAETGLYYYGARYLDPRAARWAGGDPALGEYVPGPGRGPGSLPGMGGVYNTVNLHVYHYAGNNPVKYIDPDGRETVIFSLPVLWARHLFIAVRDKDGKITTKSLYPKSNYIQAGIDAVTGGTKENRLAENELEEYEAAKSYFNNEKMPSGVRFEAKIKVPDNMTEEEFDNLVLENANNYPVEERPYNAARGPNSNTYVDDVIEKSGGKIPDIKGATQQNWGE
jgi:RHS repeat-associated protein